MKVMILFFGKVIFKNVNFYDVTKIIGKIIFKNKKQYKTLL